MRRGSATIHDTPKDTMRNRHILTLVVLVVIFAVAMSLVPW